MRKSSHVVCDRGAAPEYAFLPGSHQVGGEASDLKPPYDAVITFDSGSWQRLDRIAEALPRKEIVVINVDHHASNERFGDLNWVDDHYSSSGEMAWALIKAAGVKPDRNIATCIYTAIVTDTGRFSFANTTRETHLHAAELLRYGVRPAEIHSALYRQKTPAHLQLLSECIRSLRLTENGQVGWITITPEMTERAGFEPGETQEFVDLVKSVRGVRVALLFREIDEPGKVKISFRTDSGVDGIRLASKWGGGGHRRASGATIWGNLQRIQDEVVTETVRFLRKCR
jgi:phosphoesterase RecJ-like protein